MSGQSTGKPHSKRVGSQIPRIHAALQFKEIFEDFHQESGSAYGGAGSRCPCNPGGSEQMGEFIGIARGGTIVEQAGWKGSHPGCEFFIRLRRQRERKAHMPDRRDKDNVAEGNAGQRGEDERFGFGALGQAERTFENVVHPRTMCLPPRIHGSQRRDLATQCMQEFEGMRQSGTRHPEESAILGSCRESPEEKQHDPHSQRVPVKRGVHV